MKKVYQTEQRKQIIEFLRENSDQQYTIDEILNTMKSDTMPGKSTVYRLIGQLVEEGHVRRFTKGNSRQFLYQLVDGEQCCMHLHLKCLDCGKLIHLKNETSLSTKKCILDEVGFAINNEKTILFGTCMECQRTLI